MTVSFTSKYGSYQVYTDVTTVVEENGDLILWWRGKILTFKRDEAFNLQITA